MVEQINSLGSSPTIKPVNLTDHVSEARKAGETQDFKDLLTETINEVNRLQAKSSQAQIDLVTGKTDNVGEVFSAM
ncbi:MAG: flagellar hook-basal body complex protein FliE, partial [Planctomycetes bacterium]|nr:flagellar hook-basal body complex protein FliE [Planctomycetota bacterium]